MGGETEAQNDCLDCSGSSLLAELGPDYVLAEGLTHKTVLFRCADLHNALLPS